MDCFVGCSLALEYNALRLHVDLVWEHGCGMSLAIFHGGVVVYILDKDSNKVASW